jgi:hypothetical protein
MTPTPVSNCSRGGSLFCHQTQGAPLPLPGPPQLKWAHDDITASNYSQGGTLPSPDNDDDAMSSSSSAPVLEGAHNCGSPEMQELLQDRKWGSTRTRLTRSSTTRTLRVRVDHGYGYGSITGTGTGTLKCTGGLPVRIPRGGRQGGYCPSSPYVCFLSCSFLLLILYCFYIDGRTTS